MARQDPERLFIGVDANAAGLRERSGGAWRAKLPNLFYVRAAVEELPPELADAADQVTVILPWGSLLAAVARPRAPLLGGIRGLCRPGAALTVVLSLDVVRDGAEVARLGLPRLDLGHLTATLGAGYADTGFALTRIIPLTAEGLARWPSTWAKRLAHGRARTTVQIEARAR